MEETLALFKALAERSRLRILVSLAQEPMYVERLAERIGLAPSTVSFHLKKLQAVGLVRLSREQYYTMCTLEDAAFAKTLRELVTAGESVALSEEQRRERLYEEKVLASFFDEKGRLISIPTQRKKRLLILKSIAGAFSPGTDYPEREVNLRIADFHDDFCTIRREFIAERIMTRENGIYRLCEPESEKTIAGLVSKIN